MKVLIDMNLPPSWRETLAGGGVDALHWRDVGRPGAPDCEILDWARQRGYVVFTHDLDFGALLALTKATGPSAVQLRTQDVTPASLGGVVLRALASLERVLSAGALVVIDPHKQRARVLPLD